MKKTKVFIDIFYYRAALSGLKTYIEELLHSVIEHGSDEIEYIISHDISKMVNNHFFVNSKFRLIRWIFQFRYLLWKQIFLPVSLYRKNIDYVICPDYVAPILCPSKKIVVIHDNLFWKHPKNYPFLWRKYFIALISAGINKRTSIVTTSNYSKNGLNHIFKNHEIKSIYQSSEIRSRSINSNNKKFITHIGTFEKRKDLITLVKAYKKLCESGYSDYKLVLAGATFINGFDQSYARIKKYINKFNLEDLIVITGYITKAEVLNIYSQTFIYVFPSVDEGFGIPLIEAMKNEVPVICSDIKVFKEIGKKSVLFFKKGNEFDLFKKLKIVINNNELRIRMIKSGKNNVKRFNRKTFIEGFEKMINENNE